MLALVIAALFAAGLLVLDVASVMRGGWSASMLAPASVRYAAMIGDITAGVERAAAEKAKRRTLTPPADNA